VLYVFFKEFEMHKTLLGMRAMWVVFGLSPSSALPKFWCKFYLPTGLPILARKMDWSMLFVNNVASLE
jgi:hypothetical protein